MCVPCFGHNNKLACMYAVEDSNTETEKILETMSRHQYSVQADQPCAVQSLFGRSQICATCECAKGTLKKTEQRIHRPRTKDSPFVERQDDLAVQPRLPCNSAVRPCKNARPRTSWKVLSHPVPTVSSQESISA